jgi:hypothetical protein
LEIEDAAGHVVLQLKILKDRIRLQGEWWDTQGRGIRLTKGIPSDGSMVIPPGPQNQHIESLIEPIFQYPSQEHWAEFKQLVVSTLSRCVFSKKFLPQIVAVSEVLHSRQLSRL